MADPVIFDCGGSTRVKKILATGGFGAMEKLMDVDGATHQSSHDDPQLFTSVAIVSIDKTGAVTKPAIPAGPLNSVEIGSENGQTVRVDINPPPAPGKSRITVKSTSAAGPDPLVEAKQVRGKRRYVVINAGAISAVSVNGAPVFAADLNPANNTYAIYTTVILSS
jgi:hypothetical protein